MSGSKKGLGAEIIEGLQQAVAHQRGELADVRVKRVSFSARHAEVAPAPSYTRERIAQLRERLQLSQPVFAQALNVSPETVRAWEQGKREPDGAGLRLLQLADEHPSWVMESVQTRSTSYGKCRRGSIRHDG